MDTNVILRFLLNDHPQHSLRARELMRQAETGRHTLKVAPHILREAIYVLESQGLTRADIAGRLLECSAIPGVRFESEEAAREALIEYRDRSVDFADALLMALARARAESVSTVS